MPPRRIAAARIAAKGYSLKPASTGAESHKGTPSPLDSRRAGNAIDSASFALAGAARALQEDQPQEYGPTAAGYEKALRVASLAAVGLAQNRPQVPARRIG